MTGSRTAVHGRSNLIRGLYTGASGMVVQMHHLDAVANNLANVDLSGYKRDTPVDKAFPEILLRRMNDDGVYKFPLGSVDTTPIVGRLGTGVELNEVYTVFEQGPLKQTENPFDLALEGAGFLSIATEAGERYTRNGSFHRQRRGLAGHQARGAGAGGERPDPAQEEQLRDRPGRDGLAERAPWPGTRGSWCRWRRTSGRAWSGWTACSSWTSSTPAT